MRYGHTDAIQPWHILISLNLKIHLNCDRIHEEVEWVALRLGYVNHAQRCIDLFLFRSSGIGWENVSTVEICVREFRVLADGRRRGYIQHLQRNFPTQLTKATWHVLRQAHFYCVFGGMLVQLHAALHCRIHFLPISKFPNLF